MGYQGVRDLLTSRIFFVSGGLLALILWLFNRWRHSIPQTFRELLRRGQINSLTQGEDVQKVYLRFLNNYQKTLLSRKRYAFSILITIMYAVPCFIALRSHIFPVGHFDPILQTIRWITDFIRVVIIASLLGYFSGIGLWAIATSSYYIKDLTNHFKLTIVLNHPDQCGGLQSIGNFCLFMALPILVGAIFFGVYGIGDTLLIGQLAQALNGLPVQASLEVNQAQTITITVVLIVFALLLGSIIFFLSLSNIHREMEIEKQTYDDEFAQLIVSYDKKIRSALHKGELKEAKDAKAELEMLQGLYPDKVSFPTWPFNFSMVFTYITIQIPAVLSLIGLVIGLFK